MKPGEKARRLRIYLSSTDKLGHTPLYEVIVFMAKEKGIAGASVIKGVMGYGASSEIYSMKIWEISEKVPMVVEIIDTPEKADSFYETVKAALEQSGKGHIVTMDETTILSHKAGNAKG